MAPNQASGASLQVGPSGPPMGPDPRAVPPGLQGPCRPKGPGPFDGLGIRAASARLLLPTLLSCKCPKNLIGTLLLLAAPHKINSAASPTISAGFWNRAGSSTHIFQLAQ